MVEEIAILKEEEKKQGDPSLSATENQTVGHSHRGSHKAFWVIGIGVLLLLSNTVGGVVFTNWWALLLFVVAFSKLNAARRRYHRHGRLTSSAHGELMGGLFIGLVGSFFLFGLSWSVWWPLFIVVAGLGALIRDRA